MSSSVDSFLFSSVSRIFSLSYFCLYSVSNSSRSLWLWENTHLHTFCNSDPLFFFFKYRNNNLIFLRSDSFKDFVVSGLFSCLDERSRSRLMFQHKGFRAESFQTYHIYNHYSPMFQSGSLIKTPTVLLPSLWGSGSIFHIFLGI